MIYLGRPLTDNEVRKWYGQQLRNDLYHWNITRKLIKETTLNPHLEQFLPIALSKLNTTRETIYIIQTDLLHKNAKRVKLDQHSIYSGRGKTITGVEYIEDARLKYVRIRCMDEESYGEYVDYFIVPKIYYRQFRQLLKTEKKKHEFKVICSDEVKAEFLKHTVEFLANAREAKMYGAALSKGILLTGTPGNGKTLLCDYLLKKYGSGKVKWCDESDLTKGHVFSSDSKVLIFDDVNMDILYRKHSTSDQVLSKMDGVKKDSVQVRVFTTNAEVSDIDPAFLRPGRIDKIMKIEKPNEELRRKFAESWHENIRTNIDIDALVSRTNGMSFAEMDHVKCSLVHKKLSEGIWNLDYALSCNVEVQRKRAVGF